jgi:hypothetical protein
MKSNLLIFFILTAACMGRCVYGGAVENVIINQNGEGTWVTDSGTYTFSGSFTTDPSGGTSQALVYDTSIAFPGGAPGSGFTFSTTGDYRIMDPNSGSLVGIVRFYGGNRIIFYDNDAGPGGNLSGWPGNTVGLFNEPYDQTGVNTLTVEAISGMPGFQTGIDRTYTFLSSLPVPEPGIFALLACSAMLLALRRKVPVTAH